jgi:hypothetical protein
MQTSQNSFTKQPLPSMKRDPTKEYRQPTGNTQKQIWPPAKSVVLQMHANELPPLSFRGSKESAVLEDQHTNAPPPSQAGRKDSHSSKVSDYILQLWQRLLLKTGQLTPREFQFPRHQSASTTSTDQCPPLSSTGKRSACLSR